MPQVGFEPTIPVFEQEKIKIVHALRPHGYYDRETINHMDEYVRNA
jgi:hypothetical protein